LRFENKELILFDLDGTLIDSVPDLANALNHTLKSLGKDSFDQDIIRRWVGNGAATLVKRGLSGEVTIDSDIDEKLFSDALKIFLDYYSTNLANETILYPDVFDTLNELKNKGYRLAIITNKPFDFIKPILDTFNITDIFEDFIGGDSLDLKKPDPTPLLFMCDKLGVDIKNTVMVGDSKNDIIAANSANMDSIALTYGYNYSEDIKVHNPTIVFDHFRKIKEVF